MLLKALSKLGPGNVDRSDLHHAKSHASCINNVLLHSGRRGVSVRFIAGKEDRYNFFLVGNHAGTGSVGVLLAKKGRKGV